MPAILIYKRLLSQFCETILRKKHFAFCFIPGLRFSKTDKPLLALSSQYALQKEYNYMSQISKPNTSADLATLIRLFGSPPLLSNEKLEHFEEVMNRFIACMCPEDFVVSIFVYQVAIETWCTIRLKRYQALMINRWERITRDFNAQRAKLREQRKAAQKIPPELIKDAKEATGRQFALTESLERTFEDSMTAIECAKESDLVVAFECGIDKLQDVDVQINDSQKRCNDSLRQIEWYRISLAHDLRKKATAIIEGECKETEITTNAVPLVPDEEQNS